ncbi:S1-like domain-containing RNA-binding protein [Alkalihalobacillus sp. LMS39]|uniref:CvfB family protein n=1 Tax=Alkalihalobacillus sp. LMS39 TaxID=2924032 RepID=UPI001FB39915|nr:S1-like domain-containing RNA-binding protein [Alkalihalobacillus sp. LMS39]UOE95625.1 S1-like domain-containing RNA-binding protein [Alkalihalobacillus sp. LMS39]
MLTPGQMETLKVARKAKFGYFLTDGQVDVLLHEREATKELEEEEEVTVYLYHDHQNRIAATMTRPHVIVGEIAWLEVVTVKPRDGLFLNNGISRDLFVSMDELPTDRNLWPQEGDSLPVTPTFDKKGRVMGKLVSGQPIEKEAKKADKTIMNTQVSGIVYHFGSEGVFLLTDEKYLALLHESEMKEHPRLGQRLEVRVTFVREDGRINVSMHASKMESQVEDSEKVYRHLVNRGGSMPYGDKTTADEVKARFNISKSAFKRALGKLMKEDKVYQKDGWTYTKEKE